VRSAVLVLLVATAGCGSAIRVRTSFPDAPMQLADDADRDQAIDRLWVETGATRDATRAAIVAGLTRRIEDAVEEDKPFLAQNLVFELAGLWRDDPETVGRGLASQLGLIARLRAMFAKAGAIEPTIATLVLLAEIDTPHRAAHLAELDEVLGFADELATAENGADAERGQPIAQLQTAVLALPLPWLVDRYVKLLEERQRVVVRLMDAKQLPMRLINAHHDVIHTAHRIANALARAHRFGDLASHLVGIAGVGADRELAIRAEIVADKPSPDSYLELARALRTDREAPDPAAALAVCMRGLADFPHDVPLLTAAAGDAASLGRVDQPIALYEAVVEHERSELDSAVALRLGKLYAQRISSLALGGRPRAAEQAWHELAELTARASSRAPNDVWRQVTAIGEASFGRGLISQGQLVDAERALVASLDRAPSIDAYETLATIYLKTGRTADARRAAIVGIELASADSQGDRYHRAKLERIGADAARTVGSAREALTLYVDAMRLWNSLGKDDDLPRTIAAERKLEAAAAFYYVDRMTNEGEPDKAIELVLEAVETDPDSSAISRGAIEFLLEIDRTQDAADALHRALASTQLAELDKVYLCLWTLGESRRRNAAPDRAALEYLSSRHGELWYEQLAEAATGRRRFAELAAAATTAPRRVELAFYGTVLGLDPAAATPAAARARLEQVVHAGMVMDGEYDLARRYLAR
jgi:tetratricopeptide (TPR) repeat protein